MLGFIKEKDTITISFNQQGKKKIQNTFCDTLVDEKYAKKWPGFQT